jgi:hypothetical protein
MTNEDIEFIESELKITLAASYRRAVVPFGIESLP